MFATILMLIVGLALSGVAAWFSVVGLIAIFSAAPTSIMIMGGTLEVAKLVCASWVYNNWNVAPRVMKAYLSAAVIMLMFITSMGIFGYLSKAHLEQRAATSDTSLQLERLEQSIAVKEKQLERLTGTEDRLNRAIDSLIEKDRVSQALAQRQRMQRELKAVAVEKKSLQAELDKLYDEKIPLDVSNRKVEAEIGPLKYIAELIYGEQAKSHFDQAVRAVIIILIVVFDPLAVIMLIAANFGMVEYRKKKLVPEPTPVEKVIPVQEPTTESVSVTEHLRPVNDEIEAVPEENSEPLPGLVWSNENKIWKEVVEEPDKKLKYSIAQRFTRINTDYVSVDGKVHNVDTLDHEIISLEAVQILMQKLTNNELSVDQLTWAECEAILKYLDNDKSSNPT